MELPSVPAKQKHDCWNQEVVHIISEPDNAENQGKLTYYAFQLLGREELKELTMLHYYEDDVVEHYKHWLYYDKFSAWQYLTEAPRLDEPKMPVFTKAVETGAIAVGTKIEGNILTTTYGHLCDLVKPEIVRYVTIGKCTYNVTKDNFIWQRGFRCNQCFPKDPNNSICESCAKKCHKGHELIPLPIEGPDTKAHLFCDCYNSRLCACK